MEALEQSKEEMRLELEASAAAKNAGSSSFRFKGN